MKARACAGLLGVAPRVGGIRFQLFDPTINDGDRRLRSFAKIRASGTFHLNNLWALKRWHVNRASRRDLVLPNPKAKFGISAAVIFRRPIFGGFLFDRFG
jgi:hypothetical protein